MLVHAGVQNGPEDSLGSVDKSYFPNEKLTFRPNLPVVDKRNTGRKHAVPSPQGQLHDRHERSAGYPQTAPVAVEKYVRSSGCTPP